MFVSHAVDRFLSAHRLHAKTDGRENGELVELCRHELSSTLFGPVPLREENAATSESDKTLLLLPRNCRGFDMRNENMGTSTVNAVFVARTPQVRPHVTTSSRRISIVLLELRLWQQACRGVTVILSGG